MTGPTRVGHLIGSTGLYGAERWVLALMRHMPETRVQSLLVNLVDQPGQTSDVVGAARARRLTALDLYTGGRFDLRGAVRLAAVVRERGLHVLHSHGYKSDLVGLLAARLSGAYLVATPHGWNPQGGLRLRVYEAIDRIALRFADRVCPLSPELRDGLVARGVPGRKLRLILNGVDLDEVDATPPAADPRPGGTTIGYVGQLIARKNVECLLSAFARLAMRRPDFGLTLVGDGPLRSSLEQAVARVGLRDRVRFAGYRPEGVALLKTFDLLVLASWEEGIPRSLMEAMAAGIPVVASDIPGNRALVRHEDTGVLFCPSVPRELVDAVLSVVDQPERAKTMAQRARAHVERHFSARRMAEEYADLYRAC